MPPVSNGQQNKIQSSPVIQPAGIANGTTLTIPPYDVAGPSGAFNVYSQSDGSISQSVSIELAAPVMPPVSNGQQNKIQSSPVIQPAGIANVNPFYCKLLAGNIRVCRGCRGSLRTTDGGVPPSPYNLITARAERCTFRNTSGELITPRRETICHYHCKIECIRAAEASFVSSSLSIPADIRQRLDRIHVEYLQQAFGILIQ